VLEIRRLGKRIVFGFPDDLFLVLHLMIAGRLRWLAPGKRGAARNTLARFAFPPARCCSPRRAQETCGAAPRSRGAALQQLDPGGLEVLDAELPAFAAALRRENHTLKRGAHRSAPVLRHRQRVFRRDPARRPPLPARADAQAGRRGDHPRVRRDPGNARGLDRPAAPRVRRPLSGAGRESPRSAPTSPCTAASASRARPAARRCSASATPRTRRTTCPAARRRAVCWPTGRFRACSARTGRARSTNLSVRSARRLRARQRSRTTRL